MSDALPLNMTAQTLSPQLLAQTSEPTLLLATVLDLPTKLSDLTRPVTLTGSIIDLLENGSFQLKTSAGVITLGLVDAQAEKIKTLSTLLSTPTGRSETISLLLQAGAPPKQATLILPKTEAPLATEKGGLETKSPLGPMGPTAQIPSLQAKGMDGISFKITVLPDKITPPIQTESSAPKAPQSLTPTQPQPQIKQERAASKISAHADSHETQATKTSLPENAKQEQSALRLQAQGRAELATGQSYQIKIKHILTPETDWPSAPEQGQIKATVLGKSMTGQTLLQAEDKTLFVHDSAADLPVGTKILVTTQKIEEESLALLPPSPDRDFQPLREIMGALQTISPKGAQALLHLRVPTPAHHLAPTTLFLLSALHHGKIEEWMGPAALVALEKNNKSDLKDKLVETLKDVLESSLQDPTVGTWKAYPIPLHYDGAYELVRLYIHKDSQHNNETGQGPALNKNIARTRFVITMNMSRLGSIQLDGLSQKKQLDLVIRSEHELPEQLTSALRNTAIKSLEAVGLIGTLLFQTGRQNWVTIEDNKIKPPPLST